MLRSMLLMDSYKHQINSLQNIYIYILDNNHINKEYMLNMSKRLLTKAYDTKLVVKSFNIEKSF